jgi:hypothetical protein
MGYIQSAASTISGAEQLEELLEELCISERTLLTIQQVDLRQRQLQSVSILWRKKDRMEALREFTIPH